MKRRWPPEERQSRSSEMKFLCVNNCAKIDGENVHNINSDKFYGFLFVAAQSGCDFRVATSTLMLNLFDI